MAAPTDPQTSREAVREQIYHSATVSHEGRRTLLSGSLALTVFLLVIALAVRQVTAPARAGQLIEPGIASTTDLDRLIQEDQPAFAQLAQSSTATGFAIPGYPLKVYLSRDELALPAPQLREIILSRSSPIVYRQGLKAFDLTGNQAFSRFSAQGLLDFIADEVSAPTHSRASVATIALSIALAVLAGAVLVSHDGWSRFRVLGIAVMAGAAPVAFLSGVSWLIVGRVGGSDPYIGDLRTLARSVIMVPLRDSAIVFAAALALTLLGPVFGHLERRFTGDVLAGEAAGASEAAPDD